MRKKAANRRPLVAVVVGEGFGLFETSIALEIFGSDYTAIARAWYRCVLAADAIGPVASSGGLALEVRADLAAVRSADIVIVPPARHASPALLAALQAGARRGARLVSLCTGAFVLAEAGLLDGRLLTTHWHSAARLAERVPSAEVNPNVLYIDGGDVLTSAGAAAAIDLCLHIVRSDFGAAIANTIARDLVVPPHRDGGQAQYVDAVRVEEPMGDPFTGTLAWALEHLADPISIEDLARRSAMSMRSFARRFVSVTGTTPHKWLTRQRVMLAQQLLETTDLAIEEIARRTGFGTAANLRQHFRSAVMASPASYRRTFKHPA